MRSVDASISRSPTAEVYTTIKRSLKSWFEGFGRELLLAPVRAREAPETSEGPLVPTIALGRGRKSSWTLFADFVLPIKLAAGWLWRRIVRCRHWAGLLPDLIGRILD
jgi:hypothetical protein